MSDRRAENEHMEKENEEDDHQEQGVDHGSNEDDAEGGAAPTAGGGGGGGGKTGARYHAKGDDESRFIPATHLSKFGIKYENPNEPPQENPRGVQTFMGEWDLGGAYLYQAFNDDVADFAVTNQKLGGPGFNPTRMTWVKPSFAWVLYRSGYGSKHGQTRVLKIKLPHEALATLLTQCFCVDTNKATRSSESTKGKKSHCDDAEAGGMSCSNGRVQWDPERDIMEADGKEPRAMLRRRAIQIGIAGKLSQFYVDQISSIEDVTELAHKVCAAHRAKVKKSGGSKKSEASESPMSPLLPLLPQERPYMPQCSQKALIALGMYPGETAETIGKLGRGKVTQ